MACALTQTDLDAAELDFSIDAFLEREREKDLLRFSTAGSVDDGKSTLIGRLLYDTQSVYDDQVNSIRGKGTTGQQLDFALLTDGLRAEREQGITIDVAYRYFSTPRRKFIIADAPGHEQYTRNMATGASTADLAVVLVDAQQGITEQTQRHSFIASLLGIRAVVLAVNKMDLVNFSRKQFEQISADYRRAVDPLGFETVTAIPISARFGDNVVKPSRHSAWYTGPSLLSHLETVEVDAAAVARPFRMPVQ